MLPKLIVFDLAGTTVADGDAVNRCLQDSLAAAGHEVSSAQINTVMGLPKPDAIRPLVPGPTGTDSVAAIHADFVARMTRFYRDDPAIAEVPGTSRVFAALRAAGIKLALNTGFSRPIVQPLLGRLNWDRAGLVDATLCSDEVARGRPHPDMIFRLMAILNVADPRHVFKVGDTPADLAEGTNAGCGRVFGVTNGTHTRKQLTPFPHTDLIYSVVDLPEALGLACSASPHA